MGVIIFSICKGSNIKILAGKYSIFQMGKMKLLALLVIGLAVYVSCNSVMTDADLIKELENLATGPAAPTEDPMRKVYVSAIQKLINKGLLSRLFSRLTRALEAKGYDLNEGIGSYYDEKGREVVHKQLMGGFRSIINLIVNIMKHTIIKKLEDPLAEVKKLVPQ